MPDPQTPPKGVDIIAAALGSLPAAPGVYRMLDCDGSALYVGKARSLKRRVTTYTQVARLPERLRRMVSETVSVEIITTHTEAEALLLEANLIKKLRPKFNILLRDDKSYPWLMITEEGEFPQLVKHRGARTRKGRYWGPFASAWSVNQTIQALQRVFLLRTCADSVFANRSRPCLLYQIKRCSAPCVGRIDAEAYGALVRQASDFLSGRAGTVQRDLAAEMQAASESMEYERAAAIRDRIRGLAHISGDDVINPETVGDADVIAIHQAAGQSCVQVFFIRGGRNYGNRSFFPTHAQGAVAGDVIGAFITQFYDDKVPPPLILLSTAVTQAALLRDALSLKAGHKVEMAVPQRGEKRQVVDHAATNAREALERKLAESAGQEKLLSATASLFGLEASPQRIEIYDNSHIMGTNAYGVMVVAGPEGFVKSAYRRFAIKGPVTPGDDFAMMREVLTRRFARAQADDPLREEGSWPDLVVIDGGQGQLSSACAVLDELGIVDIPLVAIAKGPDRDAGREWFHLPERAPFQLPPRHPVLYFLQRLRDEAHRYAITTHRAGRSRKITTSELDGIPGIGAARKRALLNHFGSARGVRQAGLKDLEAVAGINRATARLIYGYFNPDAQLPGTILRGAKINET
ncbi:excinuclease ABC subunit UvrC [Acidiphilium sp. C61]|jgi:excinuclease ABC subunit C|uniref:excinuclease ABC subunit UvrC n=1 Tax=Acidiphilium sp. C61 TaxID=1671485 RepID=UPI00157A3D6C|nr:excinuclease ABC subunit UvrC [Acidiphilium sp. C61]